MIFLSERLFFVKCICIGSGVGDTQYIGGYNRSSFVDAMEMSGVEGKYANKVIDKMVTFKENGMILLENRSYRKN